MNIFEMNYCCRVEIGVVSFGNRQNSLFIYLLDECAEIASFCARIAQEQKVFFILWKLKPLMKL